MVSFTSRLLYTRGKSTCTHRVVGWVDVRGVRVYSKHLTPAMNRMTAGRADGCHQRRVGVSDLPKGPSVMFQTLRRQYGHMSDQTSSAFGTF